MADPARLEAHRRLLRTPPGKPPRDDDRATGLAHDLFTGVRKYATLLDAVLGAFTKSPPGQVEPEMREALRLGAFQLLFQSETPPPLIVASTVELAGKSRKRRGFLNAVLRRIVDACVQEDETDAAWRSRRHLPVAAGRMARFDRDVLPDPAADLDRFLAVRHALRYEFVAEMRRELPLEIDAALAALNRPLPLALRTNRMRTTPEALADVVSAAGGTVLRTTGDVVVARLDGDVDAFPPFVQGLCAVQDATAAEVAPFLGARPGEAILDLCAGVGGKTAHLAELALRAGGPARILACDVQAVRLARLQDNVRRLGLDGVTTKLLKLDGSDVPPGPFDRVLVDAPCSNTGVLMKRAEARHRLGPEDVRALAALQGKLLDRAAATVRRGGILVYATCSLLADENRRVIGAFLGRRPGEFQLEEERLRYPHRTGRDGGYMARLVRN